MLACAFAIFRYAQAMEPKAELGWKEMAFNVLAHSAMVFTHTFDFFIAVAWGWPRCCFGPGSEPSKCDFVFRSWRPGRFSF